MADFRVKILKRRYLCLYKHKVKFFCPPECTLKGPGAGSGPGWGRVSPNDLYQLKILQNKKVTHFFWLSDTFSSVTSFIISCLLNCKKIAHAKFLQIRRINRACFYNSNYRYIMKSIIKFIPNK